MLYNLLFASQSVVRTGRVLRVNHLCFIKSSMLKTLIKPLSICGERNIVKCFGSMTIQLSNLLHPQSFYIVICFVVPVHIISLFKASPAKVTCWKNCSFLKQWGGRWALSVSKMKHSYRRIMLWLVPSCHLQSTFWGGGGTKLVYTVLVRYKILVCGRNHDCIEWWKTNTIIRFPTAMIA